MNVFFEPLKKHEKLKRIKLIGLILIKPVVDFSDLYSLCDCLDPEQHREFFCLILLPLRVMTGIAIELVLDINFSFVIIDLLIFAAKFENQTAQ